jgi:hypothetical protein
MPAAQRREKPISKPTRLVAKTETATVAAPSRMYRRQSQPSICSQNPGLE